MKKKVLALLLTLVMLISLSSCECEHEYGDYIIGEDPTCTESGEEEAECSKCGEKDVRSVAPTGHGGEWQTVTAASCIRKGAEKKVCPDCGHTEERETDLGGHTMYNMGTDTYPSCLLGNQYCKDCGKNNAKASNADHTTLELNGERCPECFFSCVADINGARLIKRGLTWLAEYYGETAANDFSLYYLSTNNRNTGAAYISATVKTVSYLPSHINYVVFEEGSNLHTINAGGFKNTDRKSITLPASLTKIGANAFKDCEKLERVVFENTEGWSVTNGSETIPLDLSDPVKNAGYLTETYLSYTWVRL